MELRPHLNKIFLILGLFIATYIFVVSVKSYAYDNSLVSRLNGYILLQVESHGEAWYVSPVDQARIYMRDGFVAYDVMANLGLGITNADLAKIRVGAEDRFECIDSDGDALCDKLEEGLGTDPLNPDSDKDGYNDRLEVLNNYNPLGANKLNFDQSLADRLRGRIVLQVESHGEAWYINPQNGLRYYMPDGPAAYQIMRFLSLGITNNDLAQIPISSYKISEPVITPPINIPPINTLTSDTQAPTAPSNLTISVNATQLTLSWSASTDNIGVTQYRIERSTSATTGFTDLITVSTNSYINSALAANTKYYYRIRAVDVAGNLSAYSSIINATTGAQSTPPPATGDTQAPTAPTALAVTVTGSQAALQWAVATDNVAVTGYRILRSSTSGGTYVQLNTTTANSYIDNNLNSGTYYYIIKAYDAAANISSASNEVEAIIIANDNPPVEYISINQPYSDKIVVANIDAPENTNYTWYRNSSQAASGVSATTFLSHFDGNLKTVNNEDAVSQTGVSYASAKFGQAMRGKAEYPITNNLNFEEGTIEFWLILGQSLNNGVYDIDSYIFRYINPVNYQKIMMNIKTDISALVFTVHSGSADTDWSEAIQINTRYQDILPEQPIFLAMTYSKSANKASLYLNGFKIAQDDFTGFNFDPANSNLVIGNNNALVDEFRILNKALSSEEIMNNYTRGTAFGANEIYYTGNKNLNDDLRLSINLNATNYGENTVVKNSKIYNISPDAYVLSNRSSINLTFNTVSAATCRYGQQADDFDNLPYSVSGTGTSHSINYRVNSIVPSHDFYIKCQSASDGDDYAWYRRIRVLPDLDNNWPKVSSITWGNTISDSEVSALAKYDMISLAKDNLARSGLLKKIKEFNPQIILLPYVNAPDNNISYGVSSFPHQDFFEKLSDTWRLRNAQGQYITNLHFPNVMNYNLLASLPWAEALSQHVRDDVISRGDWDGVWYDVVDTNFWWLYDYTLNRYTQYPDFDLDGVNEDLNNSADYNKAKNIWVSGMAEIMTLSRQTMGQDVIIVGNNGDANANLYSGKMWERFLYYHEGGFTNNLSAYLSIGNNNSFTYWNTHTASPHLNWNLFEMNTFTNYKRHRLGLAASLLGGVYYNPADRNDYRQIYWFDEFWVDWDSGEVTSEASQGRGYLGQPVSDAYMIATDIWRRDFQHGIVIVNSSANVATIDLGDTFRYIKGLQDAIANPGGIVSELVLSAYDARILLTTKENDPLIGPL